MSLCNEAALTSQYRKALRVLAKLCDFAWNTATHPKRRAR